MKKILFNDHYGLTEAVLSGRKTMTRRVDKRLNHPLVTDFSDWSIDDKGKCYLTITYLTGLAEVVYPTYQIGEEIAIAQPYKDICLTDPIFFEGMRKEAGWSNKMFVCAEYMPHRIHITDIWLERLQNIIDEECLMEGVEKWMDCYIVTGLMERSGRNNRVFDTPREAFATLIDRVYGRGTWRGNPWVVAYTFKEQETNKRH